MDQGAEVTLMDKRSSKKMPRDLKSLAASIVNEATNKTAAPSEDDGKNLHAVALGRMSGAKGGAAHA